jgi:hypothetical protein
VIDSLMLNEGHGADLDLLVGARADVGSTCATRRLTDLHTVVPEFAFDSWTALSSE